MRHEAKHVPLNMVLAGDQTNMKLNQPMDNDCFNMVVRIVACDDIQFLIEPPVHSMDLRFCVSSYDPIQFFQFNCSKLYFYLSRR